MFREQMVAFIKNVLSDIMQGSDFQDNVNPALLVSATDSDERFKDVPADEMEQKKNDCMEMGRLFWDQKEVMSSYDLLVEIIHHTRLCDADIELLSDIITHGISNKEPNLIKLSPKEMAMRTKMAEVDPNELPFEVDEDSESGSCDVFDWDDECDNTEIPSPKEIYEYLDQHVYKQDDAKRAASMIYWEHLKGIHTNSVLLGPSGSGKTEIFRQLQTMRGDVILADGSSITQEGWRGSVKLRDILRQAAPAVMQEGGAIIVIDEFDKMAERKMSGGENIAYSLQSELLKVIEGEVIQYKDFTLDTSRISFVFLGSFASMVSAKKHIHNSMGFGQDVSKADVSYMNMFTQEDLIRYGGVRREIASRISRIVQLQPMGEGDFYNILNIDSMSPIAELQREFETVIDVDEDVKRQISEEAAESGLGVRYLKSRLLSLLEEKMFAEPDMDEYEITS